MCPSPAVKNMSKVKHTAIDTVMQSIRQAAIDYVNEARDRDRARPIGTKAVDVGLYDPRTDSSRPAYDMIWCVIVVKWTGHKWRRLRRVTGPVKYDVALIRRGDYARKNSLPTIHQV